MSKFSRKKLCWCYRSIDATKDAFSVIRGPFTSLSQVRTDIKETFSFDDTLLIRIGKVVYPKPYDCFGSYMDSIIDDANTYANEIGYDKDNIDNLEDDIDDYSSHLFIIKGSKSEYDCESEFITMTKKWAKKWLKPNVWKMSDTEYYDYLWEDCKLTLLS